MFNDPIAVRAFVVTLGILLLAAVRWKSILDKAHEVVHYSPVLGAVTPLDRILDCAQPLFSGAERHMRRLTIGEFEAWCHSRISGGIGANIRNQFLLWNMYHKYEAQLDEFAAQGHVEEVALYRYLRDQYQARDPDAMSAVIIRAMYLKYQTLHPDVEKERKEFQLFKQTAAYQPLYPFDVRFPKERELEEA